MPSRAVQTSDPEVLSKEDRQAGYILVELGPKLRNLGGEASRTGIFHETDWRHPIDGQAHVVDGRVSKVFPTAGVRLAEAHGRLQQVTDRPETPVENIADSLDQTGTSDAQARQQLKEKDDEIAALRAQLAATKSSTTPVAPDEDDDEDFDEDEDEDDVPATKAKATTSTPVVTPLKK